MSEPTKDVGLIDPGPRSLRTPFFPNLAIGYIATTLERDGRTVDVIDQDASGPEAWQAFLKRVPPVIGITATSFTWDRVMKAVHEVKAARPDARVVIGGPHVSVAEGTVLDDPMIDYAVIGEGEPVMPALTALILEGRETPEALAEVPGLIYRSGGERKQNEQAAWVRDLVSIGRPAFDRFDMDRYGCYPLLTSRGCPYLCVFCSVPTVSGRQWRYRPAEDLVAEVEWALGRYSIPHRWFVIVDDTFNLKLSRVYEFCDLIEQKKLNIIWGVWGFRADRAPKELCERMRRAGCLSVAIGIESATDEMLVKIRKGETLADLEEGIANLSGAGIEITGQFMIGNPGETVADVEASIDFARRMPLDTVQFYLARPYPKTELWNYAHNQANVIRADYTRFHHFSNEPVFDTPEFPAADRIRLYKRARRLVLQRNTLTAVRRKVRRLRQRLIPATAAA